MITLAQEIRTFFQISSFQADKVDLLELVLTDEDLVKCLANKDIPLIKKIQVLQQASVDKNIIDDLFFFAQLQHNHGLQFAAVKPYVLGILAEQTGAAFVEVYTREPIALATLQSMQKSIQSLLFSDYSQSVFHFMVDPDILGGFRICHRDTVWDYTVEAQLSAFHQQFISL